MATLMEKVEGFVLELFQKNLPNTFIYHNFRHTERVVKSTKELIQNSEINVKQKDTLLLAAWFHDTGYTVTYEGHEEESAKIAERFLSENNVGQDQITEVKRVILATKFNVEPKNILEEIIKDADTSHFGKDYFEETSELLRQELQLQHIQDYSNSEWIKQNIKLLTTHHKYYTQYAHSHWQEKKEENLRLLLNKQNDQIAKLKKEETKARLKAKYKNESPERGIQTLFRVTMRNHLKLSDIADTKANILLSVNAIIVSLALSNIIPEIVEPGSKNLMIPTLILLVFSVASIVGAILSTRPNVTSGEFTKEQIEQRKVNVLFFGNFHKMPYDEFEWAMNETIKDQDFVYTSLMKDLYLLGIVLDRKYRLLRITYTIFMIGIILSVLSFIITFYLL